ncbi:MAG: hypothetical protein ACYSUF_09650, partial [Planctomycetota bacterium]
MAQARRLLDFLGVGWDESVLEFHTKARKKFISTPSSTAVPRKIYKRSAGRWRNYEDQVQRVSGTLARFTTVFGYDGRRRFSARSAARAAYTGTYAAAMSHGDTPHSAVPSGVTWP